MNKQSDAQLGRPHRYAKPTVAPEISRWLALGGIVGPIPFALAWIVFGLLRPGYSSVRQQISDLGLGLNALAMNTAFVLMGLLLLAGVVGFFQRTRGDVGTASRWTYATLLALAPLGGVLCGLFTEAPSTQVGHVLGAMLGFLTPIIGFLVTGLLIRRSPRWRRIGNCLLLASPLTLLVVSVFFKTGPPGAQFIGSGLGGLTERVMIVEIHAWYVVLGWLAFRRS